MGKRWKKKIVMCQICKKELPEIFTELIATNNGVKRVCGKHVNSGMKKSIIKGYLHIARQL